MSASTRNLVDQFPRWALVVLALIGVVYLKELRDQINHDHVAVQGHGRTLEQHASEIQELKKISGQLTVMVDSIRKDRYDK